MPTLQEVLNKHVNNLNQSPSTSTVTRKSLHNPEKVSMCSWGRWHENKSVTLPRNAQVNSQVKYLQYNWDCEKREFAIQISILESYIGNAEIFILTYSTPNGGQSIYFINKSNL